jgi:hypothetical protein
MKHTWLIGLSTVVGVAAYGMNLGYGADKDLKSVTTTAKKPVAAAPTTEKAAAAKPVPEDAAKKDHAPFRFKMRHRLTPEQGKQMEAITAKYQKPEMDLQQQIAKLQHELEKLEAERGAAITAVLQEARTGAVAEVQQADQEKAAAKPAAKSADKPAEKKPAGKTSAPQKK